MDKILELLGAEKLNEDAQTEIKEKLQDIVEVKALELTEGKLQEEKNQLIEEYEDKFDEYKTDITSKFSNFVDTVLDEEMIIPEKIVEYARKGELYSDLIEQFKTRLAIDEGLLDAEVKGLLKEAKEEIISLREDNDSKTATELELQSDAQELAAALYLNKKCDGLTESQKSHVVSILEGITDKEEIDRKFDVVLGTHSEKINESDEEIFEDDEGNQFYIGEDGMAYLYEEDDEEEEEEDDEEDDEEEEEEEVEEAEEEEEEEEDLDEKIGGPKKKRKKMKGKELKASRLYAKKNKKAIAKKGAKYRKKNKSKLAAASKKRNNSASVSMVGRKNVNEDQGPFDSVMEGYIKTLKEGV